MTTIEKALYTGRTHTTSGRDGFARSDDAQLDVRLSPPGTPLPGTNAEQLFAAGWSARFIATIGLATGRHKLRLPADSSIDAEEVDLGTTDDACFLQVHQTCPVPGRPAANCMTASPLQEVSIIRVLTIAMLAFAVLGAPCVYDAVSSEPSPLTGLIVATGLMG